MMHWDTTVDEIVTALKKEKTKTRRMKYYRVVAEDPIGVYAICEHETKTGAKLCLESIKAKHDNPESLRIVDVILDK